MRLLRLIILSLLIISHSEAVFAGYQMVCPGNILRGSFENQLRYANDVEAAGSPWTVRPIDHTLITLQPGEQLLIENDNSSVLNLRHYYTGDCFPVDNDNIHNVIFKAEFQIDYDNDEALLDFVKYQCFACDDGAGTSINPDLTVYVHEMESTPMTGFEWTPFYMQTYMDVVARNPYLYVAGNSRQGQLHWRNQQTLINPGESLVSFGDSLSVKCYLSNCSIDNYYSYPLQVATDLNIAFLNFGRGGAPIRDNDCEEYIENPGSIWDDIQANLADNDVYDVILANGGTNDIRMCYSDNDENNDNDEYVGRRVAEKMQDVLVELQTHSPQVVVLNVPPISAVGGSQCGRVAAYNSNLNTVAAALGIQVIDIHEQFDSDHDCLSNISDGLVSSCDNLHWTGYGEQQVAKKIVREVTWPASLKRLNQFIGNNSCTAGP